MSLKTAIEEALNVLGGHVDTSTYTPTLGIMMTDLSFKYPNWFLKGKDGSINQWRDLCCNLMDRIYKIRVESLKTHTRMMHVMNERDQYLEIIKELTSVRK